MRLTREEAETFEIARAKVRDDDEAARLEALVAELGALPQAEDEVIARIRANRLARGEKVRAPTAAERAAIDDLQADTTVGLDRLIRDDLAAKATAGEVVQVIAHGQQFAAMLGRLHLHYLHPDDATLQRSLLARREALGDAMMAFGADPAFERWSRREVARQAMALASGGGGELVAVLDVDNDHDAATSGKALGKAFDTLDAACGELGVTPLSDFLGIGGRGAGDWFDPEAGLATLHALAGHVAATAPKAKKAVLAELRQLVDLLSHARDRGARFHFEVDV